MDLALTRFNNSGPLLRLKRYDEARQLLIDCRQVFDAERANPQLGKVYGALAALEHETGNGGAAVRFEQLALGYRYQTGEPRGCAIGHHNLAHFLECQGTPASIVLTHRLAAALIELQIRSGGLDGTLQALVGAGLPAVPTAFDSVVDIVEQVDGVRFRDLFGRLPPTAGDGDAAIATVWRRVQEAGAGQSTRQAGLAARTSRLFGRLFGRRDPPLS